MQLTDISNQVDTLAHAWEEFKTTNETRLREIEKRGSADPLTEQKMGRLNHVMDQMQGRMAQMETALSSPAGIHEGGISEHCQLEHKAAFAHYVRQGAEHDLAKLETKALSGSSDADGGYLVPTSLSSKIQTLIQEVSPIRTLARIEQITTDALDIVEDPSALAVGWTQETAAVTDTATPQISRRTIPVHELYAQPKATQRLIDDAAVDIESWLAGKIAESFGVTEGDAFINGDGIGKPRGILSYADGTSWGAIEQVASGVDAAVTADSMLAVYFALKEQYLNNASVLMHRTTIQAVRQLKESATGQYIWNPGLAQGTPDTLLGLPVYHSAAMPVAGSGSLSVAIGDFKQAYTIVDRVGMRVMRDPFTEKPFVKFYATKRVGGDVTNFEAIKLLKLAL